MKEGKSGLGIQTDERRKGGGGHSHRRQFEQSWNPIGPGPWLGNTWVVTTSLRTRAPAGTTARSPGREATTISFGAAATAAVSVLLTTSFTTTGGSPALDILAGVFLSDEERGETGGLLCCFWRIGEGYRLSGLEDVFIPRVASRSAKIVGGEGETRREKDE